MTEEKPCPWCEGRGWNYPTNGLMEDAWDKEEYEEYLGSGIDPDLEDY